MNMIFLKILDMSFMASWLMIAVMLLRLLLKKAPKWIVCMLWILVGVRLICPFTVESAWSLVPDSGAVLEMVIFGMPIAGENAYGENISGEGPAGIGVFDEFSDRNRGETTMPGVNISETDYPEYGNMGDISAPDDYLPESLPNDPGDDYIDLDNDNISALNALTDSAVNTLEFAWLAGVVLMLLYSFISYYRLHGMTAASMEISAGANVDINVDTGKNVFQCDTIDTPFILGIIRPRIYLPSAMEDSWTDYVIAHEKAHIRRHDHWWKPMGFLILSVYWFNPLCWLSYILLCRDIELACDESVIRTMDADSKKIYAKALLSCSVKQKMITACPLAFGEVGIKERIRGVMNYKKPAFWIIAISLIACIVVAVCFLTNPKTASDIDEINETDASNFEYHYDEGLGGIVITGYIGEDAKVSVPNTISGNYVVEIGDEAFRECDILTDIIIPKNVARIGDRAFSRCENLKNIYLPEGVTTIGVNAFDRCLGLTSITIPGSVTDMGYHALNRCDNLTDITIHGSLIKFESVNSGDYLEHLYGTQSFYGCRTIENVTVLEGTTTIDPSSFQYCSNLLSVTIPDTVTEIKDHAFNYCTSLTEITIPDSVTYIGNNAFDHCSSLTHVELPETVDPDNFEMKGSVFAKCTSLEEIILPDGITSLGIGAFNECKSLTNITIPDSVTSIGGSAFRKCESLTEITLPDGITSIKDHTFDNCVNLISINIPAGVTRLGDGAFFGCSSLKEIILPDGITYLGVGVFTDCENLTNIVIPDSISRIDVYAFVNCTGLRDIILPDSVEYVGRDAFSGCSNLTVTFREQVYDSSNFEDLYSLFNNEDESDVISKFMEADWEEVRNLPYKDYYDVTDWNGIVCIGDLSERGIRIYGYNDDEITGQGIAIEMQGYINYFDWNYITPRVVLPDFYWDEENWQLQGSFHIYTGTGYDADMLAVFQYDGRGTLQPSTYGHGDYADMLTDRMDYRYNEDTGELVFIDLETNEEISMEAPEEAVTALAWGDISGFELGDTIIFSVTPGYIVDGAAIPQYDNMPMLEFEIIINFAEDGNLLFEIGDLISVEVEE